MGDRLARQAHAQRARPAAASAERELGGEHRGVRAAGAVRGAVGVALALDLTIDRRRLGVEEQIDRARAVPAGEHDDAGAEREHRAQRAPRPPRPRPRSSARLAAIVAATRRASTRASGRFGVSTVARGRISSHQRPLRVAGRAGARPTRRPSPDRPPPACRRAARREHGRPRASTAAVPSIPTLTASTAMSASTARTCASTISAGTGWIAVTPTVFCAVIAVIALVPCTPQRANAFRSAWMPAPPPESEPAMVSAVARQCSGAGRRPAASRAGRSSSCRSL